VPDKGYILKLGHIVHAVKDLDVALGTYEKLFRLKPSNRWEFQDAGLESAFVRIGSTGIQLVQAKKPSSFITRDIFNNMEQKGEGLNHCIMMTDNLKAFVKNMKAKEVEVTVSTMGGKADAWIPREYTHGILYQVVEPQDYFSYFKWGRLYD
jgi:4-hydroxyphenylpyruvate dioxygenase-like putative hemolysin